MHYKLVHHLDSFATVLLLLFYNLHTMCLPGVRHSEVTVISNGGRKEKMKIKLKYIEETGNSKKLFKFSLYAHNCDPRK